MNYYIFGIQRSGTNLMERIMSNSVQARKLNTQKVCWKHDINMPSTYDKETPTIIIYKNPYTWVESLCNRNRVDWIQTQKRYPADKGPVELRAGKNNLNVQALAKTYSHFHHTWIFSNPDINSFIIKYEDMLQPQKHKILNDMAAKFNIKNGQEINWRIPQYGKVSQSADYDKERERYYLDQKPSMLTKQQIEAITNAIGPDNIQKLGYVPL